MELEPKTKLQSAMEYLMTYGWAILAIAIVMVSLYSLGIFNSGNLQPVAAPGSCQIVRTAAQISLAGQCSNLIPKYVGQFNGNANVSIAATITLPGSFTYSAWIFWTGSSLPNYNGFLRFHDSTGLYGSSSQVEPAPNDLIYVRWDTSAAQSQYTTSTTNLQSKTWYFYTVTYNSGTNQVTVYVNTVPGSSVGVAGTLPTKYTDNKIGVTYTGGAWAGYISNVQLYNTSLDSASIKALYLEGIGGTPINVQNLVGWWPLNGNANDYSGNNNQGTATNTVWNANWQSGYTAPAS
ncbi:MAG: LamG domain-containing protein [Candidatus Micrarchaeota archaeon]|nr:LamG domain-containing protein [Candidatus Micrarchaeota archaeon]